MLKKQILFLTSLITTCIFSSEFIEIKFFPVKSNDELKTFFYHQDNLYIYPELPHITPSNIDPKLFEKVFNATKTLNLSILKENNVPENAIRIYDSQLTSYLDFYKQELLASHTNTIDLTRN